MEEVPPARRPRHRRPRHGGASDRLWDALRALRHWPWVVFPMLAVLTLVVGADTLPDDLAAARGEGVLGTLTAVEDLGCGRSSEHGCSWSGTFVSDDGTVRVEEVSLHDGRPGRVGGTARVRHVGAATVYLPSGDTTWRWNVAVQVVSVATLVGTVVLGAWRRARAR